MFRIRRPRTGLRSGAGSAFTYNLKSPPFAPLSEIVLAMESAGLPCALGGSGLLAAFGLVRTVNDWDLTCDSDIAAVSAVLGGRSFTSHGSDALHADHKFALAAERVEVICGFAFRVPGGVVRLRTVISGRWRGIPLGGLEAWAVAYTIMGDRENSGRRRRRASLLFGHLARHGADPVRVQELLRQPLPGDLAPRLSALPARATSSTT